MLLCGRRGLRRAGGLSGRHYTLTYRSRDGSWWSGLMLLKLSLLVLLKLMLRVLMVLLLLRWVLQSSGQRHDALQLRLLFLRVESCPLLGLLSGSLGGSTRLEFSSHSLQVVRHFRVCLEEEQLQVSCLVFQLDLRPIFQNIRYSSALAKQGEDLAPMRALDHIEAGHECLFLLLSPGSSSRVKPFSSRMRRRLG